MRIGFHGHGLASPEVRGLTRYTVNLLRALSSHDDVELVLFSPEPLCAEHLVDIRASVVIAPARRESIWTDWQLPALIRDERLDVFHAPADRGLPFRRPCPFVVTVHGSFERPHWRTLHPGAKRKLWYWRHELANRLRADAVVTVSATTRRELIHLGIAPPDRIHMVYPATAPEFSPTPQPDDAQVRRALRVEGRYVLYVGGYNPHRNIDALVSAFDSLPDQDLLLVVAAAHKWDYEASKARWRGYPSFARIRMIDVRTGDLPALYRGAEVFVNPSLADSFSFPLVEALSCGTPAIVSSRTAMPEIAAGAALVVDPESRDGLRHAIRRVLDSEPLRQQLRARGLERARRFSWARTARETLAIYRRLIGRNGQALTVETEQQHAHRDGAAGLSQQVR